MFVTCKVKVFCSIPQIQTSRAVFVALVLPCQRKYLRQNEYLCGNGVAEAMVKTVLKYILTVMLMFVSLACSRAGDIKVTGYNIVSMVPTGLSSVKVTLSADIVNNRPAFSLKDVEGSMVYVGNGEKINVGNFKADPCELPKGSSKALATVYLSLDEELSLLKIFTMARNFQLEDYVVNASGVVKTGGISRKLSFKDIPLRKFIDKTYRKK